VNFCDECQTCATCLKQGCIPVINHNRGGSSVKVSKSKSILKLLRWAAVNGLMAVLMWFGFGPEQVEGARYVYTFFLCLAVFMTTFCAFHDELKTSVRANGRSVHGLVCYSYDIVSAGFLVWQGHWFLGLLIMWQAMCLASIYGEQKTAKEQAA
jgi:hypothetical protein